MSPTNRKNTIPPRSSLHDALQHAPWTAVGTMMLLGNRLGGAKRSLLAIGRSRAKVYVDQDTGVTFNNQDVGMSTQVVTRLRRRHTAFLIPLLGASLNRKLVMRVGVQPMLVIGTHIAALAGLSLLAMAWTGIGGFLGIVVPLFVYVGSLSLITANALARALEYFPQRAGTTAALFGAAQFGFGALAGAIVGQLHDGTALPMAAVVAATGVLSWSARYLFAH